MTTSAVQMAPAERALGRALRLVRARWRLRRLLRGSAVVLAIAIGAMLVAAYGMEHFRFGTRAVAAFRIGVYALVALAALVFIGVPLARRPSDRRVALYLEEHEPSLDAALLSAVELRDARAADAPHASRFLARLVEGTASRLRTIDDGRRVERRALRESGILLALLALAGTLTVLLGPAFIRDATRLLLVPWRGAAAVAPYSVEVEPGNATVAAGGDQEIHARLHGFASDTVILAVRRADSTVWHRIPMAQGAAARPWSARLFDLVAPTDYYVESNGVRSTIYRLSVARLPFVKRLDLEYRFPAYTGLPVERVEDGGDIAALRGTTVIVRARPTMPVRGGRLLVEGRTPIAMTLDSAGTLRGALVVRDAGFYHIELVAADGRTVTGSLDYTIDPIGDAPPTVRIRKPGRDTKASAVEEVLVEVEASDDYGVRSLELAYRVNGGEERTLALQDGTRPSRDVVAAHTFFLEELKLKPGDMIAYYARATDGDVVSGPKRASSDIYFVEVRPFARDYRQSQQGGGGGGGGGAESPNELSARQREIVAATFKVERDSATTHRRQREQDLTTILLAQGRLREQVTELQRQMVARGVLAADSSFRVIADELPKAAEAMRAAEEKLVIKSSSQALPPEQRALQHLQRAEAAYREVQVGMGAAGGGGGGGGSTAEDLADLFELQTDKLRNQYETVERGTQQRASDAEIDETLERLKQLASRQQQESERARSRLEQMRQQGGAGGGGGGSQRQLADEAEQLARRLERLAREQQSASLDESARRLKEAADMMRRAAASPGGSEQSAAAARRLEDARRLMDQDRGRRAERDARDLVDRADRIAREQRAIAEELSRVGNDPERARRLGERKDSLAAQVGSLETQLDRLARESRRERPEGARRTQEAAEAIRDSRLQDKIRFSKGLVRGGQSEYARNLENQIGADVGTVREKVANAASALSRQEARAGARAAERARDLVRALESLDRRAREQPAGDSLGRLAQGGQSSSGQQQSGRPGSQQGGRQSGQQGGGQGGQQGGAAQGAQGGARGGERGLAQGGGIGRQRAATEPGGAGGVPGVAGRLGPEQVRQLGREYRERRAEAEGLRRELAQGGLETGELDRAIDEMRRLESPNAYDDPEGLRRLQEALLERMKEFEFGLRRRLDDRLDASGRPVVGGSGDVPAGYRKLVDEYFRALSRKP